MSNEYQHNDPWDQGMYQTGSTQPPKRRGGLTAVLLIAVIFLAGIAGILGLWNIRLFAALQEKNSGDISLSLQSGTKEHGLDGSQLQATEVTIPGDGPTITLSDPPETEENAPQTGGLSLQEIYARSIDSVVSISCSTDGGTATGTGLVISEDGYLVTNSHVIEGARTITVQFTDQQVLPAVLVGKDVTSDLAVLYVEATDLTAAQFGNSDQLRVGDSVCAIGDPLGVELRGTMTDGIVSAINRDISTNGRTMTLIQTNAALNSGNSGGPLINCYGQVIGINTMKMGDSMSTAGVEGLGFAIPSTTVKEVVDQLIAQGYVSGRPCLGITGEAVSPLYQYYYRLPAGLLITDVTEDSHADRAGLEDGDILLTLDGKAITNAEDLTAALYGYQVGDTVEAVIYRSYKQYTVKLIIEEAKG